MSIVFSEADPPVGETAEIAPGVVVKRRSFLSVAAAVFGMAYIPDLGLGHPAARPESERFTYEEFLREVVPVARKLVADTSAVGQDRYLLTLASFAVRMADVPVPEMRKTENGRTYIGANDGGDPFVVLHWRMEPGSTIGDHPHIYGNVMTLCLEGQMRVRNHEMIGKRDFDAKGTFTVRRTHEQWLSPGQVNLVNLEHGYIHGFQAGPNGARGLDITTRIKEKRPTPSLKLASKPLDEQSGLYEATWAT